MHTYPFGACDTNNTLTTWSTSVTPVYRARYTSVHCGTLLPLPLPITLTGHDDSPTNPNPNSSIAPPPKEITSPREIPSTSDRLDLYIYRRRIEPPHGYNKVSNSSNASPPT